MVHAAHASRYHWGQVGGPEQLAIGEWQCARVYSVLGRAEPALHHARRCLEIATAGDVPDWLVASAHEGLARAYLVAGDRESALARTCTRPGRAGEGRRRGGPAGGGGRPGPLPL